MAFRDTVAFLGPRASYTHQAALDHFDQSTHELRAEITIEDVFAAVQDGRVQCGVVPFENSSNGSVVFTLDLFSDLKARYPDIVVCGESYVRVSHCLLGRAPPGALSSSSSSSQLQVQQAQQQQQQLAPPKSAVSHSSAGHDSRSMRSSPASSISGRAPPTPDPSRVRASLQPLVDISHVRRIYSHPQAWGQCKGFLAAHLKGVEQIDCSSTSKAAEEAARDSSGTSAAISSALAAQMYGVDYLARGIEDSADNTTRFFVIRRKVEREAMTRVTMAFRPKDSDSLSDDMDRYKTMVSFTVPHYDAGALADALHVFKEHGLNLTSLNTRPSGFEKWNYVFFVEFKGRRLAGKAGAVNEALADLGKLARSWRWLGSWERKLKT
ncbi:uncharacterized protein K452DRAFT_307652 [Aplosporella prunicola CBS 121167]|uniref:prephenate dehydratase n=1 Tax=Aplosporella prunicola CBS 121167 TaxID=1176127 RepID=A0A6A6BHJ0_9PEZI|nr:uncharacterized protein K452DRAFT_307652 [Aplosporella prunicola CBS 121167]KAF2142714.1 hypothetical protein K452DRAFT_307652 [Aplosporella prunicola CBS 121167]